jgi:hypothetical protein
VPVEFAARPRVSETPKHAVNLSCAKMADVPVPRFRKYWSQELASLKYECHAIRNKYPEAVSVVQQEYKVLDGIAILAG